MKFKTRLVVTFLTIILLPLVLACTAFLFIGGYLTKGQEEYGLRNSDYNLLIDPTLASKIISDGVLFEVKGILEGDSYELENIDRLSQINESIEGKSSYILVRKQDEIYYTGNELAAGQIFDKLPDFQGENIGQEPDQSR